VRQRNKSKKNRFARVVIDTSLRGQGYGEQLVLDALGKAVAASEIGGGRLIVVDARYRYFLGVKWSQFKSC
jgi:predicted GNAT family N-acyltransferase